MQLWTVNRLIVDRDSQTKKTPVILLRIKFSDLNLGILHKLDAGQNRVPEGGSRFSAPGFRKSPGLIFQPIKSDNFSPWDFPKT